MLEEGGFEKSVGIINTGYGCTNDNIPSIYTRLDSYLDWIDQRVYGSCAKSFFT